MTNQKLETLKSTILSIKSLCDELESQLNSRTNQDGVIANIILHDFLSFVGYFAGAIKDSANFDSLISLLPNDLIDNATASFNKIQGALNNFKNDNFSEQQLLNHDIKGGFEASKSYSPHFLIHLKSDLNKSIAEISDFTKKHKEFNDEVEKAKKTTKDLAGKQKIIDDFYNKLQSDLSREDKLGVISYVDKAYTIIKQKHEELFVTIKDFEGQNCAGDIKKIESAFQKVLAMHKEMKAKYDVFITDKKNIKIADENGIEKEQEVVGQFKEMDAYFESYKNKMDEQSKKIDNLNTNSNKALGHDKERLMVETFQKEAKFKNYESWFMFILSLCCLFAMVCLGYDWLEMIKGMGDVATNSKDEAKQILKSEDIIFRIVMFIPLGLGFWFCNKRHDMLSMLAAEYRYKCSIVEAMIGYRAKYNLELNDDGYKAFFDKTFKEINKNPADKINKMLMKNNFSVKNLEKILEKFSKTKGGV